MGEENGWWGGRKEKRSLCLIAVLALELLDDLDVSLHGILLGLLALVSVPGVPISLTSHVQHARLLGVAITLSGLLVKTVKSQKIIVVGLLAKVLDLVCSLLELSFHCV